MRTDCFLCQSTKNYLQDQYGIFSENQRQFSRIYLEPHKIKVIAVVAGGMRTHFLLDRFPDIDINNLQ